MSDTIPKSETKSELDARTKSAAESFASSKGMSLGRIDDHFAPHDLIPFMLVPRTQLAFDMVRSMMDEVGYAATPDVFQRSIREAFGIKVPKS